VLLDDGDELLVLDDGVELLELEEGEELVALEEGDEPLVLPEGDEALLLAEGDEELLGEEAELDALWPDCDEEDAPPCTPSAWSVCSSSWPDWLRLFCCWNCFNAASVFGPILPSTVPTSKPFDCSASWAWRISELPCDDMPWSWLPCACEYCWEALLDCGCWEALLDDCDAWLPAARAAVLEIANAAATKCASFMV
jgi:hypothetical protein